MLAAQVGLSHLPAAFSQETTTEISKPTYSYIYRSI